MTTGDHVSNTLLQIYHNPKTVSYVMYNDEEPNGQELDQAHAKVQPPECVARRA
jgi:hypothetical protein